MRPIRGTPEQSCTNLRQHLERPKKSLNDRETRQKATEKLDPVRVWELPAPLDRNRQENSEQT